jgi:hypothetical protein
MQAREKEHIWKEHGSIHRSLHEAQESNPEAPRKASPGPAYEGAEGGRA